MDGCQGLIHSLLPPIHPSVCVKKPLKGGIGTSSRKLSYELRFFNFFTNEPRMQCVRYATTLCYIFYHIDPETEKAPRGSQSFKKILKYSEIF